jgi:hypothetical protein
MAVTRLSGGLTPANGSDPRTFPAIWNATADDIEQAETDIATIEANDWVTTVRIDDGAVTAPKLATTAGAVMVFADATARDAAIVTPAEGMAAYLSNSNIVSLYDGAAWKNSLRVTGGILQVIEAQATTLVSSSSTSYADTGITATITPTSATSKILVTYTVNAVKSATNGGNELRLKLFRGATELTNTLSLGFTGSALALYFTTGNQYLDSPNTTSATTYKLQFANGVAASQVQVQPNGATSPSSITLLEVAG